MYDLRTRICTASLLGDWVASALGPPISGLERLHYKGIGFGQLERSDVFAFRPSDASRFRGSEGRVGELDRVSLDHLKFRCEARCPLAYLA